MTAIDHSRSAPSASDAPPHRAGHVVLLLVGALLALVGLTLAGAAAALGWVAARQRGGAFLTSSVERYTASSYAITTEGLDAVLNQAAPPLAGRQVATVLLRATPATPGRELFIGIAPAADVDRYLRGVAHSEIADVQSYPFRVRYREVAGEGQPAPPTAQAFWTVSDAGAGPLDIEFPVQPGRWSAVLMNADGSPAVAADVQVGFRSDLTLPAMIGISLTALLALGAGVVLTVLGAAGLGPRSSPPATPEGGGSAFTESTVGALVAGVRPSPIRLTGHLDDGQSRGLWLVKWLLILPHVIVLIGLYIAFAVTTVIAAFAILTTGRYPRGLFAFNVGVLRWGWRVGFYSYSALGTDRYPPFTLARADYPADLEIEYPERLSRGLVLVKSWLLALPHLLIVGLLTSNTWYWVTTTEGGDYRQVGGISLLGLLVLVGAIVLLFTGRYPRPVFDLVMGINRWVYRVAGYVALMRDEYPPFRLDQGEEEPAVISERPRAELGSRE